MNFSTIVSVSDNKKCVCCVCFPEQLCCMGWTRWPWWASPLRRSWSEPCWPERSGSSTRAQVWPGPAGQGMQGALSHCTGQGGQGTRLCLSWAFYFLALFLLRSFPAAPPISCYYIPAEWYPPFPKGRCYVLWYKICLNNFKHRSWKLTWDMSKTEYFWLVYYH